jgi:hypothetical protein
LPCSPDPICMSGGTNRYTKVSKARNSQLTGIWCASQSDIYLCRWSALGSSTLTYGEPNIHRPIQFQRWGEFGFICVSDFPFPQSKVVRLVAAGKMVAANRAFLLHSRRRIPAIGCATQAVVKDTFECQNFYVKILRRDRPDARGTLCPFRFEGRTAGGCRCLRPKCFAWACAAQQE